MPECSALPDYGEKTHWFSYSVRMSFLPGSSFPSYQLLRRHLITCRDDTRGRGVLGSIHSSYVEKSNLFMRVSLIYLLLQVPWRVLWVSSRAYISLSTFLIYFAIEIQYLECLFEHPLLVRGEVKNVYKTYSSRPTSLGYMKGYFVFIADEMNSSVNIHTFSIPWKPLPSIPQFRVSAVAKGSKDASKAVGEEVDNGAKGSGTTARGRRLLKVREEKRKREYDRIHNYPSWAKVLEDACKNDEELRSVLGDSIGNPELMRKRVEERVRKKGRDFSKSKTGSVLAFKVSFRDFNPLDSHIWFELFGSPTDRDVDLLGSVIQSWYVMGRLGAFNSSNLQVGSCSSMEYDPLYDADKGFNVMPSSFHDIGDIEFQDNWGRVWVDLGTSDLLAIDVLLNCLTVLSSEYLGIQQVVFGGQKLGDWEEGMKDPDFGYKYFKI